MRRKLIFVVVWVLVLFLAACQAGGEPKPVVPPASPQPPEERVLVLWTHEYSTFTAGLRDKWIPEFGAALVRAMNRVVYDQMAPAETAHLLQNELLLLP